ncbi:chaperonin 10-like protein [Mycena latifolia]|nr:chaperonin 10-like protein [Mycena latifolia]
MSLPTTMLAAVYEPGNEKLVLDKNYPIRELADDEILLKVAAAGVCHPDVAFLSGVGLDTRKYIMGHEGCGVPVKLGAKVDSQRIHKGKLYSILLLDGCVHGTNGGSALFNGLGLGRDGAYAKYIITTADALVPCQPHAAKVKPGDKVLIFGIGGLGHLAVQYAKQFGATDTTIDFIANNQTFNLATAALRRNGTNFPSSPSLVLVGANADNLVFNTLDIIGSGVQIRGNPYGPPSALVAGTVKAHVHSEPLENVNKVIEELRAFEITGRKVVIPPHA